MPQRWILHADMDAFYASVEQRERPELKGKPVIVGGASARGVVSAASYEARKFGVHSAMPGFRARQLCPEGVFLPGNMELYGEVSRAIRKVFEEFTPEIEPLALDEAFLDITGSAKLFGGPVALGEQLRDRVREATQLTVSAGIAPSKLVAKIACTFSKPDGLHWVQPDEVESFLRGLPIRRLWGVGPVLGEKLTAIGIQTLGDLARTPQAHLAVIVGEDRAADLQRLARGDDSRAVSVSRAPKSYGEENTFPSDVTELLDVTNALTTHAEAVARRMRHDNYRGRTITLKAKLGRRTGRRTPRVSGEQGDPVYPLVSRSRTLQVATSDGPTIRDVALALWREAKIGEPVRLLGVSVSKLERRDAEQLDLFGARNQTDALGDAMDAITDRYGKGAISRAVDGVEKATQSNSIKRGDK